MKLKALLILVSITLLSACGSNEAEWRLPEDSFVKGVNFVGISVSNLSDSQALYSNSVDLQPVTSVKLDADNLLGAITDNTELSAQAVLLRGANAQVLMMEFNVPSTIAATPVNGPGIAHMCFQVDATTETYQKFLAGGASVIGDEDMVQLNPKNPVKYAYVADLNGAIVEIEHVDVAQLNLPTPPKYKYRTRHAALATPDLDSILPFYESLLDQKKPRRIGRWWQLKGDKIDSVSGLEGSKLEMSWFQIRNLELEISQFHSHPTQRPANPRPIEALGYNMIVLEVESLEDASTRVLSAGGKIIGTSDSTVGGPTLFARDPDGNLLGFQATDKSSPYSSQQFLNNGT
ncbi:MAG: VOC family protein [Pseudomonadota bacterium]